MLYIVATPIGNLEDITLRAIRVLAEVDLVLAEDTRKTGMLLKRLNINPVKSAELKEKKGNTSNGVKKELFSFYEHNETRKMPLVLEELRKGRDVAMVSSAGTPTISDPGYKLIKACREEGIPVTSLPGPSSIINCLALSSISHDKFVFLGYMPRKKSAQKKLLEETKEWGINLVFFESPYRIIKSLKLIKEILGETRVVIGREMTKKFEEVLEVGVSEAIEHFSRKAPKGEFVLVIDNRKAKEARKGLKD